MKFIGIPKCLEYIEFRFVGNNIGIGKKKVEFQGLETSSLITCIFDHCNKFGTIELPETVNQLEIYNCDNFGIENFYDLSLSKQLMTKYKKYEK